MYIIFINERFLLLGVPVSKRPHHLPNMAELHGLLVAKDDVSMQITQ